MRNRSVVIGLTGPTGAGKSTAALEFVKLGAKLIDCDEIAREVVRPDSAVTAKLIQAFGSDIIRADGSLDRTLLASRAFADSEHTGLLNSITHPVIKARCLSLISRYSYECPVTVVDAPLLYESGLDAFCDITAAVIAPGELRLKRLRERDSLPEENIRARMARQHDETFFEGKADLVIRNYPPYRIADEVRKVWDAAAASRENKYISEGKTMEETEKTEKKNTEAEELKKKLFFDFKHIARTPQKGETADADRFCEGYMNFMADVKTEREAVTEFVKLAQMNGFIPYTPDRKYSAGTKLYSVNRGKSLILAVVGRRDISEGVHIAAAHIDSPRLDLKPCPLYEDTELAFFKTHYYGGIKKYQWTTVPLSLHGVVSRRDGTEITVSIGEKDDEPKFIVTDLLIHLAGEQMKQTLAEGVKGENLNILIGSRPFKDDDGSEAVKLNIMDILNKKYGITEEDFLSAELEAVPAYKPCDIGLDRSMIGAYGHDDKVCAYPAFMALLDCDEPEYTAVTVLTDKEETGSDGNTGLNSSYLSYFLSDLAEAGGSTGREVMSCSECLSADVNAAFDPIFPDVMDKKNSSFLNHGVVLTKYTGSRGKYSTNDAGAEFIGKIRRLLDSNGIVWQAGELGKVDIGGGGTVAKYIASHNIDTVDLGVPVLSMHSPFEVVAKSDVFETYRAFSAFLSE